MAELNEHPHTFGQALFGAVRNEMVGMLSGDAAARYLKISNALKVFAPETRQAMEQSAVVRAFSKANDNAPLEKVARALRNFADQTPGQIVAGTVTEGGFAMIEGKRWNLPSGEQVLAEMLGSAVPGMSGHGGRDGGGGHAEAHGPARGKVSPKEDATSPVPQVHLSRGETPPVPEGSSKSKALYPAAEIHKALANKTGAFQYGGEGGTDSPRMEDLAKAYSTKKSLLEVQPFDHEGEQGWVVTTKNGRALIIRHNNGEVHIASPGLNSNNESEGGGSQVYQMAQSYAHNNGLEFRPDTIISPLAQDRRICQMISSSLRHETSDHLNPLREYGGENFMGKRPEVPGWIPGNHDHNLELLLHREYQYAKDAAKRGGINLDTFTYDPATDTIWDENRQSTLSKTALEAYLRRLDSKASGVGKTTFTRAIITGSALRGFRPLEGHQHLSRNANPNLAGEPISDGNDSVVQASRSLYYSRSEPDAFGSDPGISLPKEATPEGQGYRAPLTPSRQVRQQGVNQATVAKAMRALTRGGYGRDVLGEPRLVRNATEVDLSHLDPQQAEEMRRGGVEGYYDPSTRQTTVFTDHVRVYHDETPTQAVARVVLHERIGHEGSQALRASDPEFAKQWAEMSRSIPQEERESLLSRYPEYRNNESALAEEWFAHKVGQLEAGRLPQANTLAGRMWESLRHAVGRVSQRLGLAPSAQSEPVLDEQVRRMAARIRSGFQENAERASTPEAPAHATHLPLQVGFANTWDATTSWPIKNPHWIAKQRKYT